MATAPVPTGVARLAGPTQDVDDLHEMDADRARRPPQRVGHRRVALSGGLHSLSLPALLTLFEMERKTGVLEVRGDFRVRLHLRDGRIVRAAARGAGLQRRGREALFAALSLTRGDFDFREVGVHGFDEVRGSVSQLLLEAARRSDELAA